MRKNKNNKHFIIIWAATWQNQQCGCVASEDWDQPGHPPSLIRVFAVRMKKPWVLSYPLSAPISYPLSGCQSIRPVWGCPVWSETSLGAHSFCWFCPVVAHFYFTMATAIFQNLSYEKGTNNYFGWWLWPCMFKWRSKRFLCPVASARQEHRAFRFSVQVKIFGQGRISRAINGKKLIFHMRIYLYETSRNIQEPWPHDLYFMVHWLRTWARLSRLRFLSKVESQDLLMIFHMRMYLYETSRKYKSHELLTSISRTSDFSWFSMVNIFVTSRFFSYTDGSKLIFY